MKTVLEELTSAVQKVKSFANVAQQIPGVLLDLKEDTMDVCYSDGKKSLIEKVSITREAEDIEGKIVVSYQRLTSIIDMCQPSGEIKTGELSLSFLDGNIINIEALKYMTVQRKTGNQDENGEDIYAEDNKVVSKFSQKLSYEHPEDSIKYGVLSRMIYSDIFKNADGTDDIDGFDIWEKDELKAFLAKTSAEKGRTIYVSAPLHGLFVANLAHLIYIPTDSCTNNGFVVSTNIAKALVEIIGKMSGNKLRVCKKDRYVNIIDETDTVGIWFEMSPGSKTDLATLNQYKNKEYDTFELVFSRAALSNVVSCAASSTKDEKTTLQFDEVDGFKSLKIVSNNSGASISGDFNVMLEGNQDKVKNWEQLKEAKIPLSLRVLNDMLTDCSTPYISLDIKVDENAKFIRLAELEGKDEAGNKLFGTIHYTVANK